jgi:amino acid adenylation domain-containing protein
MKQQGNTVARNIDGLEAGEMIHRLFEEQVSRTPDAVAVIDAGRKLTYLEINSQADQVAHHLAQRGIGPDQLVGICVERSFELIVGVLGVLKAGGAYVPLDPSYPSDRLRYMLEDSAPQVVLVQKRTQERLQDIHVEMIALDSDCADLQQSVVPRVGSQSCGGSAQLAYVIYTSGSTGRPNGVMIEHRNVVNLWTGLEALYAQSRPCQRIALNASFNFDASVQQWVSLLSGRTIVIVPEEIRRDPASFLKFLSVNEIDGIDCTPSQLKAWIAAGILSDRTLRLHFVLVGGEAIDAHLWRDLARCADIDFYNVYGPTECTVDATAAAVRESETPHIGKPMLNRRVYILDQDGRPVEGGASGEIFIAGAGVARGYLRRPELTAQRFVQDPFSAESAARMYKTGDLGRWRADGTIEYLGRNDDQVKIRGFRIELGEIESQLARHEQVKEAVVIAREDAPGEKRLVAYVTAREESSPSVEYLRAHLKASLPEYMVPSAFVVLERLPLTPNGKLDRRGLPAPEQGAYTSRAYEAAQGEVEEILAGIWQELLGVERVGRGDNFFELGGHSLLIVQMMERLRRVGLKAEVRSIYGSSTLAELAQSLTRSVVGEFEVPENRIPADAQAITPDMLPLVTLEASHLERITQSVPGGAPNIQDIYPLAPLQEGILFHHLLNEQGGDAYVVPLLLSLSSREKLEGFIAALQQVIDRHDVLRTGILWEQLPQPMQVVQRQAQLPVEWVELAESQDLKEQLEEWMSPERQRLDLRHAPLLRLQVAADPHREQWYALLQLHHVISDHGSLETLLNETTAFIEGRAEELPAPVPYRNHVAQALAYARAHDAEAFFRSKLADVDEPSAPFGLLDVQGGGGRIDQATQVLDLTLAQRVRAQARRLGVSSATMFHAAWGLVVARTSAREDVVFGTLLAGRLGSTTDAQRVLGMFINTLPLRLQLRDVTVKELVEHTQRELVELLSHEQASLAVAQRCSGISGAAPLFTTLLNYLHSTLHPETEQLEMTSGVTVTESREWTNYPLTLSVDDQGDRFVLTAQTDRRINPRRIIEYTSIALASLMETIETKPEELALALNILPEDERRQVVEAFNQTHTAFPRHKLIHELFEEQVTDAPERAAIVHEGQTLTYAELNRRANQLAHYLMAKGLRPGAFVPVLMPRSPQLLIAELAVLKCGCAYVPVDPQQPIERQLFIARDCGAQWLLTTEEIRAADFEDASLQVIDYGRLLDEVSGFSTENLQCCAQQSLPAYVMYTSGSTGLPKGVVVPHHAVIRLTINNAYASISETDCVAHCSNPAFDASTFEIWGALLNGARVVIVPQETAMDSARLGALLSSQHVTVLWMTIGLLTQHADIIASAGSELRYLITGGDTVDPSVVRRVKRNGGLTKVLNAYGPTECTTFSTTYPIEKLDEEVKTLPIGRPISNTTVYILNRCLQPAPIGAAGELYIGGPGVALGYLNRPELTEERFIADPFAGAQEGRLYKTGDLGRWRLDGNIEFLGRNDQQVKIRGYRIELGEIEWRLLQHASVKDAVVIVRQDENGKQLLAYVTPKSAEQIDVEALRFYLKALLPDYMVPAAFIAMEQIPLTLNGKVDRKLLPAPVWGASAQGQFEPPQGQLEEALAGIWAEVLKVDAVGREDNFFDLGGHSLLAMQVIVRIRASLQIDVSMSTLFGSPTIKSLAATLKPRYQPSIVGDIHSGTLDIKRLLEMVAAMPESEVQNLVRELKVEGRS